MSKLIRKRLKVALASTLAVSMTVNAVSLSSSAYSGKLGNSIDWSSVQVIEDTKDNDGDITSATKITVRTGSNAKWNEIIEREELNEYKERENGQTVEKFNSSVTIVEASSSNATYSYEEGESKLTELNLDYPSLTVTLEEGKKSVVKAPVSENDVIGTKLDSIANVAEYEWTEISENPRTVTASMSNATKTVLGDDSSQILMNFVQPIEGTEMWDPDYGRQFADSYLNAKPKPDGYDFQYTSWGYESYYYAATQDDPHDSFDVLQFELTDMSDPDLSSKPKHYGYCCDLNTGTSKGFWYKLENLENSGYYNPSAAKSIRAIVNNGYWGNEGDENEIGTMAHLKKILKDAGTEKTGLTDDEIDSLSGGEALTATQLAIWKYGRHEDSGKHVVLYEKDKNGNNGLKANGRPITEESIKKINAIVDYLAELEEDTTEENTTPLINEDKFIKELKLVVNDRNPDGTYNVDILFDLYVDPDIEEDNLSITLSNSSGIIAKAELTGNDRIVDNNGVYTLSGLVLKEGDVNFSLLLEGSQNIKRGVYLYKSETRENVYNEDTGEYEDKTSQTFVSVAQGINVVDVEMDVVFSFDVKEGSKVTEHFWRFEELDTDETEESSTTEDSSTTEESSTKETTTAPEESSSLETTTASETTTRVDDDDDDSEPETTRRTTAPTTTVPETSAQETTTVAPTSPTVIYRGVEIPQSILDAYPDKTLDELFDMGVLGAFFENVPTGLLPATNDMSVIWTAISVLSAIGLAGVSVIGKKREDDEE